MSIYLSLSYWMFQFEAWIILGLILIIVDILIGFGTIILPVGVGALLVAALLYGESRLFFGEIILFPSWRAVLIWFAGLSILSVGLIRFMFQRSRKNGTDINKY